MQTEILVEKIKNLPAQRVAEVEDFVDFLTKREERRLTEAATKLAEISFEKIWDNDEDEVYNEL